MSLNYFKRFVFFSIFDCSKNKPIRKPSFLKQSKIGSASYVKDYNLQNRGDLCLFWEYFHERVLKTSAMRENFLQQVDKTYPSSQLTINCCSHNITCSNSDSPIDKHYRRIKKRFLNKENWQRWLTLQQQETFSSKIANIPVCFLTNLFAGCLQNDRKQ